MKVTLSPKAREYVKREAKYLKSGSPRAAQQFADDIMRLRQGLSRFPEMGKFNDRVMSACASMSGSCEFRSSPSNEFPESVRADRFTSVIHLAAWLSFDHARAGSDRRQKGWHWGQLAILRTPDRWRQAEAYHWRRARYHGAEVPGIGFDRIATDSCFPTVAVQDHSRSLMSPF